ncbi:MAG: transposase, partial [Acidobacteriota bacterium]
MSGALQWGTGQSAFRARLLVSWNAQKKQYRYLVTNLARERYTVAQITEAYRLRWQIELLFKEWKS